MFARNNTNKFFSLHFFYLKCIRNHGCFRTKHLVHIYLDVPSHSEKLGGKPFGKPRPDLLVDRTSAVSAQYAGYRERPRKIYCYLKDMNDAQHITLHTNGKSTMEKKDKRV